MKVKHVQCPVCQSRGKDTSRDNLAVYPDGGSFCFSCGYSLPATKFAPYEHRPGQRASFARGELPVRHMEDLNRFLTAGEIKQHFTFDVLLQRTVLLDTLPEFYWGRDGHGGRSKVYTNGVVPYHIFSGPQDPRVADPNALVVVEDPISAIAVSRLFSCLPLFGSYWKPEWYRKVMQGPYERLIFWLDRDKAKESLALALTLRHLFDTEWVVTDRDPKSYKTYEVLTIINERRIRDNPDEIKDNIERWDEIKEDNHETTPTQEPVSISSES